MSDSGDNRKRSLSTAALSLLGRRKDSHVQEDDSASEDAASSRPPALTPSVSAMSQTSSHSVAAGSPGGSTTPLSYSASVRVAKQGHAPRLSVTAASGSSTPASSTSGLHPTPSAVSLPPSTGNLSLPGSRLSYAADRGVSIEQSIRKFRIVEALRTGDTKAISKAIREPFDSGSRVASTTAAAASSSSSSSVAASSSASLASVPGGALDDTTVLHLAIQCAELAVVEFVLSNSHNGLDVNARDRDGNTPLHIAAVGGRTSVVKLLIDRNDLNDAIPNHQGKLPIELARNAEIHQMLQLSRSLFTDAKVRQVQDLVARGDYDTLKEVLEEPRLKTLLDVNSPEFASDPATVETGGSLLHEAARKKNAKLIQVLLLHGADPFRRDRKGKLPQDVTKDDITRAMLKKSPAAVAAQRGIQEKAVLGVASSHGSGFVSAGDAMVGKDSREMRGYLKKWTNYRKGYQLRWFVLENGVLSYYKHQDDAEAVCRGVINMRVAKLHMNTDEKTKFEITGKSSVKYTLKANHEVEAKKWYWALNNSIQWTKDQAKEAERARARDAEILRQAKAEHMSKADVPKTVADGHGTEVQSETGSIVSEKQQQQQRSSFQQQQQRSSFQQQRSSFQQQRSSSQLPPGISNTHNPKGAAAGTSAGSFDDDDDDDDDDFVDFGTEAEAASRIAGNGAPVIPGDVDDDDDGGGSFVGDIGMSKAAAIKDALNITAHSAKLQLEIITQVAGALALEMAKNPGLTLGDPRVTQALSTYDAATRTLKTLVSDLLKISRDRDDYWQCRIGQEVQMRRMWEESMAKVALEQEELEARVESAEARRKATKRVLREVMTTSGQAATGTGAGGGEDTTQDSAALKAEEVSAASPKSLIRQQTLAHFSDSGAESDDEEFFDAVNAGEVEVSEMPPTAEEGSDDNAKAEVSSGLDISSSFKGYENGIRTRLKIEADNRPKISLWGILKSMIGKDMTKMTLPVTFNEPTSLLYRCAEDMEYADLLDLAVERTDSIERLMYVAAFAASEYASTIGRVAKPFNPLLGESFEYVRPDKNYRFFIEQVSHHPPVGAAWAESPHWTYYGESAVRSKFYGKSFDINPLGTWFLRLRPRDGSPEELYTWKKVTSSVVGIITGNPTVDNYGPMEVRNWTTGEACALDFKARGWKASSAYQITGKVLDASGKVRFSMGGRWNSRIYARRTPGYEATIDDDQETGAHSRASINDSTDQAFLLWQANPRPPNIPFNLTPFVLTFNHVDDQLRPWLAPTDSRLRPDQRAMEEGRYDVAADEKNRLEEAQRTRRRRREQRGEEFVPAWFEKSRCETTGEDYWRFNGKYWQFRERAGPDGGGEGWRAAGLEPIYQNAVDDGASDGTGVSPGASQEALAR